MLFERYALRTGADVEINNIFEVHISDDDFEHIALGENEYDFSNEHLTYAFNNASFENLILFYTKPTLENIDDNGRRTFHFKLAYVKTKSEQLIVNTQNLNIVNELDEYQGLIDFLDIYFVVYDNVAKIAFQYKHASSVTQKVIKGAIKKVFTRHFLLDTVNFDNHLEFIKDYFQTDFENTFNASRKNKKIILFLDTINNGIQTINSIKKEYSIKADVTFEQAFDLLRENLTDNILRYSIKCEDDLSKTASIDGRSEDLRTNEWEKAATEEIDMESTNFLMDIRHFLRY